MDWKEVIAEYGTVDLVVGGSPCQSFSVAAGANRTSLDGKSNLMFEYIRAIREIRPTWLLWENVPGVLNVRDNAYGQLLEELQNIGYGLAWRTINALFFGVPQRRKRVFLVGCARGGGASAAVLFEPESVRGNIEPSSQTWERLTGLARKSANSTGTKIYCMTSDTGKATVHEDMCGTLTVGGEPPIITNPAFALKVRCGKHEYIKRDGKRGTGGGGALVSNNSAFTISTTHDQHIIQNIDDEWIVRKLTPLECERLQGFPDNWTKIPYRGKSADDCPDSPRYKAIGNSMAVPVMRWLGERIQFVNALIS